MPNSVSSDEQAELIGAMVALRRSKNAVKPDDPAISRQQESEEAETETRQAKDVDVAASLSLSPKFSAITQSNSSKNNTTDPYSIISSKIS